MPAPVAGADRVGAPYGLPAVGELPTTQAPAAAAVALVPVADAPRAPLQQVLGLAAAYGAAALLSLLLARQPGSVASIWFANALAVAVMARHRPAHWPPLLTGVAMALVLANLAWGDRLALALSFVPANLAEVVLGAWALRRAGLASVARLSMAQLLRLLLLGALISPLAGATLGAATLALHGMAPVADVWLPWFEGSVIGAVSVLPLALHVMVRGWAAVRPELMDSRLLAVLPLACGGTLLAMVYAPFPFVFTLVPLLVAAIWLPQPGLLLCTLGTSLTIALAIAGAAFVPPPVRHEWEQVFVYLAYAATLVLAQLLGAAIGELRASQALLSSQARSLQRSNAALEQFVRIASHDLREPINTVMQFSHLARLDEGDRLTSAGRQYLVLVERGGQRMKAILDGLLEFVRLQRVDALVLRPVDLREVMADVQTAVAGRVAARGASIEVAELPTVRGDAVTLGLLFQNLVANALKFVPPGRTPEIRISARLAQGVACIEVADNGIGIAPEDIARLFQPFERLHPQHRFEGAGLGLALVRQLAELHGGRVEVRSTPDSGSVFSVLLPLA
jgi:signal transduction histidine kinase